MLERPIRCRRARRSDADAIRALLGAPLDRRADRHQLREVVADLGADCYVALRDEVIVGLVHVTYARQITGSQRATVELVLVTDDGGAEVGRALAHLVRDRAQRRRCGTLDGRDLGDSPTSRIFAQELGADAARDWRVEIPVPRG